MAWYFGIAVDGYQHSSELATDQQNIVFFPAFPMLMRVAGRLLGGASTSFILGGTAIAFAAFFWALVYLFRLARDLLGDDDVAATAVWMIAAYPFALFYGAIYTESVFLLGATGAFYHFRRRELIKAAAWGLLVGFTRPNGCFLAIPLALIAIAPWLPSWLSGGGFAAIERDHSRKTFRSFLPAILAAAAPGMGVLLYSAFIWQLTGRPLAWAEGHAAWGREYKGLAVLLVDRYRYISEAGLYGYSAQLPADLLNGLGAVFVLAAVWPVWRRLGLAYAVFILINILPPMAAGGLLSVGRFSSVLFPAFLWFAAVVPARHRGGWLGAFMAVQGLNAALFYTWRELF
jgi:Mannosyltransferase (PIG-V)